MTEGGMNVSELMTKNNRRNWRRLLVGGLIAIVVLALLITAIILLTASPNSPSSRTTTTSSITLDDWLWGSLSTKPFNGTWINDDEILYRNESGDLMVYNIENSSARVLLPISHPALRSSFDHQLSPDGKYMLFASNYQKFYRHTYLAEYRIVNLQTLIEKLLTVGNSTNQQLATWTGAGNALVYVNQNNIYYRPEAERAIDYQITTSGVFGSIYNAVPDWVYEEEIFSSNKALWFSPSGKKMAFGYFDDSKTPIMNIPFYGYPGSLSFQYTSSITVRYPKSGTTNPTVKLFYVDLEKVVESHGNNISLIEIEHPPQLANSERILAAVAFPTETIVSATWMNRVQNHAYFHLYDVENSVYTTALDYREEHGWVEQYAAPHFSRDGKTFILILPQKQQSDNDYWSHLVMVTNTASRTTRALTSGTFVVTEIVAWDQDNYLVYYLATVPGDPGQQHLYRLSTLEERPAPECLSCGVKSEADDTYCLYNEAQLSPDKSHYVLTCAGPGIPDISIYNTMNTSKVLTWETNVGVADLMAEKSRPLVKRFTVPVGGGFEAQVRLLIPPGADLTGTTKYPMLVYVYGGPDTYQVTEKFHIDWGTYLVTNKNIIYAAIDGRGSGLKGNGMLFAGYRNLGTVEIYDQINVTRHLQENFPFIDKARSAIWGWSYGGYAAGMSLAMDRDAVFKCGMSVAPVTDWALYDSIYTERFMGLPTVSDNLNGYEQGQLLNKVENIKSNSYYLIHGTLDDNVHYQQSLLLAKVLEQKDILFRQQTYTDEDHGIAQSRSHLYHSMENFLDDCLIKL
ncbi:venom dipeptidyl peptidase 4 isoform X2 [Diachasma alloeum]|uniref:venom dipeptidyl peptidase 4 isoform X2 n=1 Tax=Diachasma alloeum TaxID=454923 RepID=UPI0007384419|nr:venom dipeptidyl peptidase 4 isoform X2 [Diachasma alloeum]XP_015112518.1 venom dipeptidyl peptidase 4 isoform X2 [Diachasma alloeum]